MFPRKSLPGVPAGFFFRVIDGRHFKSACHLQNINAVRRKKFTLSQTGFSLEKRLDNMEDAFAVFDPSPFKDKTVIIVDDVFATGATTFELSKVLKKAGAVSVMIWTVAQA